MHSSAQQVDVSCLSTCWRFGVNQDQHLCSQHCHARNAFYAIRTIRQGVSRCLTQSHSSHLGSAFKTDTPPIMPNMHHLATTTCTCTCYMCTTGIDVLDSTVAIVTTEQVTTRITIWPKRGDGAKPWLDCPADGAASKARERDVTLGSFHVFVCGDSCDRFGRRSHVTTNP